MKTVLISFLVFGFANVSFAGEKEKASSEKRAPGKKTKAEEKRDATELNPGQERLEECRKLFSDGDQVQLRKRSNPSMSLPLDPQG